MMGAPCLSGFVRVGGEKVALRDNPAGLQPLDPVVNIQEEKGSGGNCSNARRRFQLGLLKLD